MNFKTLTAIATTSILLLAATASQAAFVKTGVIDSINLENNTLIVESNTGKKSYKIPASAKVNFLGDNDANISNLEEGQRVKLKFAETANTLLRGEVIAVNHSDLTVQIKLKGSNTIETVKFASNVAVAGIENFSNLRAGHIVTVR